MIVKYVFFYLVLLMFELMLNLYLIIYLLLHLIISLFLVIVGVSLTCFVLRIYFMLLVGLFSILGLLFGVFRIIGEVMFGCSGFLVFSIFTPITSDYPTSSGSPQPSQHTNLELSSTPN